MLRIPVETSLPSSTIHHELPVPPAGARIDDGVYRLRDGLDAAPRVF